MKRFGWLILAFMLAGALHAPSAAAKGGDGLTASLTNSGFGGHGTETLFPPTQSDAPRPGVHPAAYLETFEYRTTLACGNTTDPEANMNPTGCTLALTFCSLPAQPDRIYYYAWYRLRATATEPTGPWRHASSFCSGDAAAAGLPAPPPVPSMAQIREAFAALGFGRPSVVVYPVGGATLVNLPTYYEIRWDESGLRPGQVSAPVQLLSWSVEFEVGVHEYVMDFGDGNSVATLSESAPYPNATIQHTYSAPQTAAQVSAQTFLTGRFRVNGGAWQPLDSVADLQNEPVTTLDVLEARARLVTN